MASITMPMEADPQLIFYCPMTKKGGEGGGGGKF